MESQDSALAGVSDAGLLAEVKRLAASEREATAALISALAELDDRKLYLGAGYSSLFTFCVQAVGLSEDAAYFRIEAARAARKYPLILERLAGGAITLTAVKLLAPHLTTDNHRELLDEARGRTRREIETIVARVAPRPDVPTIVRKLPGARPAQVRNTEGASCGTTAMRSAGNDGAARPSRAAGPSARCLEADSLAFDAFGSDPFAGAAAAHAESHQERHAASEIAQGTLPAVPARRAAVVTPLAPSRYKIQVTVDEETQAKLRRLQDLLRHDIPDGDPGAIIDRALTLLLEHAERTKWSATKRAPGVRRSAAGVEPKQKRATARLDAKGISSSPRPTELGSERVDKTDQNKGGMHAPRESSPSVHSLRKQSRHIPAGVRREVWRRDQGRCTFVGTDGRCRETALLEYHHAVPFANGGGATVANLRLTCRRHNQLEADRFFGAESLPKDG